MHCSSVPLATSSVSLISDEHGSMDFDAELDHFYIRKNNYNEELTGSKSSKNQRPLELIPLMLFDVLRCTLTRKQYIYEAFDGAIRFRSFLIYGRVVSHPSDSVHFHKYEIDDGTAVAKINFFKKTRDLRGVELLQNEVDALKPNPARFNGQNKSALDCLDRLLNKARQRVDASNIPVGSKIFIRGRPTYFRGDMNIIVNGWNFDCDIDRTKELAYKDLLIDLYSNKYSEI